MTGWTGGTILKVSTARDRAASTSWEDSCPFDVCSRLLKIFYQLMVASTLFSLWCSVVGLQLDSQEAMEERRIRDTIRTIQGNPSLSLYIELWHRGSNFSQKLILPRCKTEQFMHMFVLTAIRLYNSIWNYPPPPFAWIVSPFLYFVFIGVHFLWCLLCITAYCHYTVIIAVCWYAVMATVCNLFLLSTVMYSLFIYYCYCDAKKLPF